MAFNAQKMLGVNVNNVDTSPYNGPNQNVPHVLGTEVIGNDGALYRYVLATGTITAGQALQMDTASASVPNAVKPTSAVNQSVAGIAPIAIASGSYGWIVVQGPVSAASVATSTAAGAALGSSSTAGQLSTITISASPAQGEVQRVLAASGGGITATTAEASNLAGVILA